MKQLERVKPKPVPESWLQEARRFMSAAEKYIESEEYKTLTDPLKPVIVNEVFLKHVDSIYPTIDESLLFLETVLSEKNVSDAVMRQCIVGEKMSRGEEYEISYEDADYLRCFGEWWVAKYLNQPKYLWKRIAERLWNIVIDAIFYVLRGGCPENSYAMIEDELDFIRSINSVSKNSGGQNVK